MIDPCFATQMAIYNAWQNVSIFEAADGLGDAARRLDRGAFWGSIHGTLSHLLWGDHMWLSRFTDRARPETSQAESASYAPDWQDLRARRTATDAALLDWTRGLTSEGLAETYRWRSGSSGREEAKPMRLIVAHVFNHQTHHRGQVHAMLTAAGARPGDTDLFLLPGPKE